MSHSFKQLIATLLDPRTWQGAGVYAAILCVIAVIVSRAVRIIADRTLSRERPRHLDRAVVQFLAQVAQVAVWITVVMVFLHIVPPLQKLGTALLAGVSVASVVIGLAAQNTLSNVIAGFSLVLYRPFEVDDVLTIAGPGGPAIVGVIERLSLGYTILRTLDDRRIVVPNNLIASQVSVSSNHARLRSMAIIPLILFDAKRVGEIKAALIAAANRAPEVIGIISCLEIPLETNAISLSLRLWCRNEAAAHSATAAIVGEIRRKASGEGIDVLVTGE
jgi:small-conductance mechanosensitive channel